MIVAHGWNRERMRIRDLVRDRAVWIFGALVLALFYRPLAFETFYFRDLYRLFYPKKLLLADALRAGILPLWDPLTHGGHPYLATPSNYTLHPSNVLYVVLPTIVAFNVVLVLHVFLCAVAAYWLARVCRLSPPAAFVAGAGFALCGYTLSTANLTPLLLGLPWIPLTIGLTHRALRDGRSIAPAAIGATIPLISGAAELTAMLFVTVIVWVAFARYERVTQRSRAAVIAIVIAGAIGLSLVQTLPATSVIAQSSRSEKRSFESFTNWSVRPERLPELLVPRFLGETGTLDDADYWGRHLETYGFPYILSIYVGIPLLLLGVAGAFARRVPADVPRRALFAIVVAALLLSLGRHLPGFRLIYDYVPFVTIFRYPVKAMLAMLLPLALLAGCGAEVVASASRPRRLAIIAAIVLAIVIGGAIWTIGPALESAFSFAPLGAGQRGLLSRGFVHAALAALALAGAAAWCRRDARRGAIAIAAVVAIDLAVAGMSVNDYAPRSLFDPPTLAEELHRVVGAGRFHSAPRETVVEAPTNDLMWLARWQLATLDDYNAAAFGIPVVYHTDYDGLAPARMASLAAALPRVPWPHRRRLLDRAAVRAYLTHEVLPDVRPVAELDTPAEPLRLYANPSAQPARFVSEVKLARDARDALRLTATGDLSTAIVEADVATGRCGSAPVRLIERSFNSARYAVDAPCRGLVVFAENHYDGWRATVDGRAAPHVSADYAFTAVAVERGRRVIERRYFPPLLWQGVAGTLLTIAALVVIGSRERRRRMRKGVVS